MNRINYQSVDGSRITPDVIKKSLTETYSCVRCQRSISLKDAGKSGGLIYIQSDSDYRCAACARCMKRKRNETMRLFRADMERSIRRDDIREQARWN